VNWNACSDTTRQLAALSSASTPLAGVVVVDNGSADNSVEKIRSVHPEVTLIEAGKNLGFAAGNNLGIRRALESGADFIWLLNNDAQPSPDALTQMLKVAERDSQIGAVGSVLCYADRPGVVQSYGGGKVSLLSGYNTIAREARADAWFDYMCAASMLVRREALLDVGLLDESCFLYWEDVDFGFRLRHAGWKLAVASKAMVLHRSNASTAGNALVRDRYSTASCLRFLRTWSPVPNVAKAFFLANRLAKRLATGQLGRLRGVYRGMLDYRGRRQTSSYCTTVKTGLDDPTRLFDEESRA
jgi:GT2 family glycosyltransferase